jgi:SAM-dependent methyltransferase
MSGSKGNGSKTLPQESWAMRLASRLGARKIAWSLRRLHCPVDRDAFVLEVGAGGNPYFRSNVLVDAYESTAERHWVPLTMDRPTVLAFVEKLPFQDKAFDFVIASHVLEHSQDPARFLEEMQRVAKAGYIEVPDAFMERINPYPDHRLEITVRGGKLVIRNKKAWQVDPELVELYEDRAKRIVTSELIPRHPFDFHVRYYWTDKIDFEVVNPEVMTHVHVAEQPDVRPQQQMSLRGKLQARLLKLIRTLFSQHRRNSKIDLVQILRCTDCGQSPLTRQGDELLCSGCGSTYALRNGIPDMTRATRAR